jgi:hypothetical protein
MNKMSEKVPVIKIPIPNECSKNLYTYEVDCQIKCQNCLDTSPFWLIWGCEAKCLEEKIIECYKNQKTKMTFHKNNIYDYKWSKLIARRQICK